MSGLCRWLFCSLNVRFACCCLIGNFAISKLYCLLSDHGAHSNSKKYATERTNSFLSFFFFFTFVRPDLFYLKWYHARINIALKVLLSGMRRNVFFKLMSESKGKYSITPIGLDQHSIVWYAVSIVIFLKIFLTLEKGQK
jgi:hypothetical protein